MQILFYTLALVYISSSLLPLIGRSEWWIRVFDFPRVQFATIGILALVSFIFIEPKATLGYWAFFGLIVMLGFDARRIFPYLKFLTPESKPPLASELPAESHHDSVTIMSSNVRRKNRNSQKLTAMTEKMDPDILLLIEVDNWWADKLKIIGERYPYSVKIPKSNTYGLILFSKLPIKQKKIEYLVDKEVPSIFAQLQHWSGQEFNLIALHPRPPRPKEGPSVERDAELLKVAKIVGDSDEPTIVVGDLNDVAWSYTTRLFQRVSGMLDPRKGRGFFNTFPVHTQLLRVPLDHIFHTGHFCFVKLKVLDDIGSDHFPIFAKFAFPEEESRAQKELDSDSEDRREARKRIRRGREWDGPRESLN